MRTSRPLAGFVTVAVAALLATSGAQAMPASPTAPPTYKLQKAKLPDGTHRLTRWNPCQPTVTVRVNPVAVRGKAAKNAAVRDVKKAFAKVQAATGIDFTVKGRTKKVPRSTNISKLPAEIVVAFVRPRSTDFSLAGSTAGQGGSQWRYWKAGNRWRLAATRGYVVIDAPQTASWSKGFGSGVTRGNLLLHELGHVMGLLHVTNRHQLMYPNLSDATPNGYAKGDRIGLRKMGRSAGCIKVPAWVSRDLN
ncbi:MAG: matrixin family metalloprotease [Nocardioidaceae bacterium]